MSASPPPRGPILVRPNPLRAAARTALCVAWTVAFMPPLVALSFGRDPVARLRRAVTLTHWWGRGLVPLMGFAMRVRGTPPPQGVLVAPNHTSYADIAVATAALRTFVLAKTEIGGWPLLGWVTKRSLHPFTSRLVGRDLVDTIRAVGERLSAGMSVCAFLEGTTTGGDRVLKFMASLVEPALQASVPVVPVAIRWSVANPKLSVRDDVAYWRDDVFGPHAWRFLGLRGIEVDVTFLEPIATTGKTRRAVAEEARAAVVRELGLENAPSVPEYDTRPATATPDGGTGTPA